MQVSVKLKTRTITGSLIAWNEAHPKYKGNIYFDDQKHTGFLTHDDKVVLSKISGFSFRNLGTYKASFN